MSALLSLPSSSKQRGSVGQLSTLADYTCRLQFDPDYMHITSSLVGVHNVYNTLAAVGAVNCLGIEQEFAAKAIKNFKAPVGRFDRVENNLGLNIIIDFAHTPNAMRNVLSLVRKQIDGAPFKLIALFGCAGERDKYKRKQMGKIAAKYADVIILTAEDPRTEEVNDIIDQIAQGCIESGAVELPNSGLGAVEEIEQSSFFRKPDRYNAIQFAINEVATVGDWVLLLGKGHEQLMCYVSVEHPWDERGAVEQMLTEK